MMKELNTPDNLWMASNCTKHAYSVPARHACKLKASTRGRMAPAPLLLSEKKSKVKNRWSCGWTLGGGSTWFCLPDVPQPPLPFSFPSPSKEALLAAT
eukprot:1157277-Pelagomonas_calceolata.AAC.3